MYYGDGHYVHITKKSVSVLICGYIFKQLIERQKRSAISTTLKRPHISQDDKWNKAKKVVKCTEMKHNS